MNMNLEVERTCDAQKTLLAWRARKKETTVSKRLSTLYIGTAKTQVWIFLTRAPEEVMEV